MSDAYKIGTVTVTPGAGGYYMLTGKGIDGDGEKVQGKEKADARAKELDQSGKDDGDDGAHIPPQGDMVTSGLGGTGAGEDGLTAAQRVHANEMGAPIPPTAPPPAEPPVEPSKEEISKDEKLAATEDRATAAEAAVAELSKKFDELLKAVKPAADIVAEEAPAPTGTIPATVPQAFDGSLSKEAKKALKDAGLGYTRIVLEENESIPPTGLFVSVNGRAYMIKPGEEVDVPDFVLGVLDDAKMSSPVMESSTQKVIGWRDRSKYPYRRVNEKD